VAHRHTEREIFAFLTGDFECAWDALAERSEAEAPNRGNFMFALQSMVLLEWLSRLCASDKSALSEFAVELRNLEPKYFTALPVPCKRANFSFPGVGSDPLRSLLAWAWDLIRNGHAHQYHDIVVELTDGKHWALGIEGVKHGWPLSRVGESRSSLQHLHYLIDQDEDVMLLIHPGALFLDLRDAARNSRLLDRGLTIEPFKRGGRGDPSYQFDRGQLESALGSGGHFGFRLPGLRGAVPLRSGRSRRLGKLLL
jgi:hypothetical protein